MLTWLWRQDVLLSRTNHARTNLNILIPRATRLTLQPNSDNRRPKETKGSGDEDGIWKKFWVENSTSLLYLPISSLADTRKILRNMLRNFFFFAQADNLSKKNPYFGKHLFRKTRTSSSTPLRGWENSWSWRQDVLLSRINHARTNLNILIPRATRLTLQPNSDNRRPKETKGSGDEDGIWKKFWVENSTSLLYLPISSLADTRKIVRNMLRNFFFFCSSWQFKQEKFIFWKASFSQNKNILHSPSLRGWENSWSLCNPRLRLDFA